MNTGLSNTVVVPENVGNRGVGAANYLFLATDEQTIDLTFEMLDEGGNVLFAKTVTGVPLKRNRYTRLFGQIFSNDSVSAGFQVETDWLEGNTMNF